MALSAVEEKSKILELYQELPWFKQICLSRIPYFSVSDFEQGLVLGYLLQTASYLANDPALNLARQVKSLTDRALPFEWLVISEYSGTPAKDENRTIALMKFIAGMDSFSEISDEIKGGLTPIGKEYVCAALYSRRIKGQVETPVTSESVEHLVVLGDKLFWKWEISKWIPFFVQKILLTLGFQRI